MTGIVTVTEDVDSCLNCGAPAVRDDERHRHCNACGMVWERMTEEDELDIEADRATRGRGWADERGRSREIRGGQERW